MTEVRRKSEGRITLVHLLETEVGNDAEGTR